MNIQEISLQECPSDLRMDAEQRLSEQPHPWELLSVMRLTSTPYIDNSLVLTTHEVILCKANTFIILDYTDDGNYQRLSKNIFTLGTLKHIMDKAPAWMGLARPAS